MKKVLSIFIFIIFVSVGYGQLNVTGGVGFDDFQIGMSTKQMIKILGKPSSALNFEEEKKDWQDFGYDVDKEYVILLGFDSVYIFDNTHNKHCIWKVYVDDHKVKMFNIAYHQSDPDKIKQIRLNNKIPFQTKKPEIEVILGKDCQAVEQSEYRDDLFYGSQGIGLVIDEDGLINIFIFEKLEPRQLDEINKKMEGISPAGN